MKRNIVVSFFLLTTLVACKLTNPFKPVPEIILAEVLQNPENCRSTAGVESGDDTYSFSCSNSADTLYTVSMTRFKSEASAYAQFESSRGNTPAQCFHGYDLYEAFQTGGGNQFIVGEQTGWQAGRWVVSMQASYDYRYFHFTSVGFSEVLYTSGVKHRLFPAGTCPMTGTATP